MADTLKFGPEWLRALSDGGSSSLTSPPQSPAPGITPNYKLAEHRYGREEMLALLSPDKLRVPERLKEHTALFNEKPVQPLAFISPSEDETRLLAQSVNSTAVLRSLGRGTGPVSRGGRGVAGERGRGRGRGRGEGGYFTRGASFDDESGFGRGGGRHGRGEASPWEEGGSREVRFERSFSTRTYEEVGGTTSPRKEFMRSLSSENWREARREEDRGGQVSEDGGDWRRAGPRDKWSKSSNWREAREAGGGFDRSFERGRFDDVKEFERNRYRNRGSGSWDDDGDGLPEWATENDTDNLGTFDSSGAFMSMKEAQAFEEFRKERKARQKSEEENAEKKESQDSPRPEEPDEKKEKLKPAPEAKREKTPSRSPQVERKAPSPETTRPPASLSPHPAPPREPSPQPQLPSPRQPSPAPASTPPQEPVKEEVQAPSQPPVAAATPPAAPSPVVTETRPSSEPHDIEDQFDHLEKAAEHLVATWTAEEDAKSDNKAKVENGTIPQDHEHAQKWFYRDPQGDLQGPFSSQEMAEWFSAGYFTMSLLVKRGSDPHFTPLGELIKIWRRLPFLPGPPPAKSATPSPPVPTASVAPVAPAQQIPAQQLAQPQAQSASVAAAANAQYIQQQVMLQQQLLLRQLQMQQMAQVLQTNKAFAELPPQQQQNMIFQMVLQQQQQQQMLKTTGASPGQAQTLPVSTAQAQRTISRISRNLLQSLRKASRCRLCKDHQEILDRDLSRFANGVGAAALPRSLSPSQLIAAAAAAGGGFPNMPNMGAVEEAAGGSIWGGATPPPSSVAQTSASSQMQAATTWSQAGPTPSVWDIEPPENTKRLEDIEREQMEKLQQQQREQEEREAEEQRRREEELRQLQLQQQQQQKQKEEEERRRKEEEERRKQMEIEQQKELERLKERQRLEQLRREQEEARRREEERRRLEEEQRRRQEEEEQRRRQEEEERRRRENEEIERKRQEEIMRRQKAEEMRRQQEALRRMQQEQLVNMQLPSSAQWGQGRTNGNTSSMSLAEIQALEAEQQRREEEEKQHRLEMQRQQLAAIQQQQAQHNKSWTQQKSAKSHQPISLLEIQQEQAIQLQQERNKSHSQAAPAVNVPLATSAVWGGGSQSASSHWAAEGAWGRAAAQGGGIWDDAPVVNTNKKSNQSNNNAGFPALRPQQTANQNMNATSLSNKNKAAKSKKDEEVVQRLFQAMKPKDEFTQWCENALKGMPSSVDIPTFIAFLQDIESPYEVHDYIHSYLGETKEMTDFAKQFLARRNKGKNQTQSNQVSSNKESQWDMPALTSSQQNQMDDAGFEESKATKKKKKRQMQKVDSSILGFTVQAAVDRKNVGEIDTTN